MAHKGRIPYLDDKQQERSYYPDFWVDDWSCYVEIKNIYHMSLQPKKFDFIRLSNPNLEIRILLGEELRSLGVAI
jgi:hypothetical protein